MTQEELRPTGNPRAPEKLPLDFSAFHQMHRPRYVREAERCLRCRADAEDAVDEAFVQLAREWPQILRTQNPAAYAWRVMKNRVVDHARARGRRATLMDTAVFETVTLQGAEDAFEVIEQNLRLFHAIAALPERQQDVIRLRYCEGYSTADVALHLGITEAGVRSTERYAKRRLREIYTSCAEEEAERP
ncbi:sigma-70 family RNA polymerase sigma factor [Streptomyces sp. NBC_00582]|uniref:sigma-70 family RNA polymerase sigma factor n=1 Tax=Streptomyces sp. NBC_00582 TaxID=2975783 RepID=UPI0010F0FB7F|nr:sigma-70 family RNA polymerase sigma factor [Streptomyces sp. NBC_00582]WUB66808.1 sigma-70 family RNA polymerase sigma factor [Streptomyces sp. NBC_00582]